MSLSTLCFFPSDADVAIVREGDGLMNIWNYHQSSCDPLERQHPCPELAVLPGDTVGLAEARVRVRWLVQLITISGKSFEVLVAF